MKLFLDLDGVLCDFEKGVFKVFNKFPKEIELKTMWKKLASIDNFYANLDWTSDGRELWEATKHLNPTILTGIPLGNWAPKQKKDWCAKNLGKDVEVITCFARDKHTFANVNDILIDDTLKNKDPWISKGGIFILHTDSKSSITHLKDYLNELI